MPHALGSCPSKALENLPQPQLILSSLRIYFEQSPPALRIQCALYSTCLPRVVSSRS